MKPISKMNINEMREVAIALGADAQKLYGVSRTAMLAIINNLRKRNHK